MHFYTYFPHDVHVFMMRLEKKKFYKVFSFYQNMLITNDLSCLYEVQLNYFPRN